MIVESNNGKHGTAFLGGGHSTISLYLGDTSCRFSSHFLFVSNEVVQRSNTAG